MKKLVLVLLLLSGFAFSQTMGWVYQDVALNGWDIATDEGMDKVNVPGLKNVYGTTVDSTGKVWGAAYYQRYYFDEDGVTKIWPDDIEKTVKDSQGNDSTYIVGTYPLFVKKLDGTVDVVMYLNWADGTIDTLFSGDRGLATHPDGSIIYCASNGDLYKINPLTYEPMLKINLGWSTARPDVDADGYIYNVSLFGGDVQILDGDDFSVYNTIPATAPGVSRGIGCSADGQHVFVPSQNGGAHHYFNVDGVDGTYALIDTIGKTYYNAADDTLYTLNCTLALWDPAGLLWLGRQEAVTKDQYIMWAFDPDQDWLMVDDFSFKSPTAADTTIYGYSAPEFPRCIRDGAFSSDGMTMYLAEFYGYTVKEYHFEEITAITDRKDIIPDGVSLRQNYPNPFNPTTNIPFTLIQKENVRLKIYDNLGREVATVINEVLNAGEHTYKFDGTNMASGTYYYKLTVGTKVRTGRMMLLK